MNKIKPAENILEAFRNPPRVRDLQYKPQGLSNLCGARLVISLQYLSFLQDAISQFLVNISVTRKTNPKLVVFVWQNADLVRRAMQHGPA